MQHYWMQWSGSSFVSWYVWYIFCIQSVLENCNLWQNNNSWKCCDAHSVFQSKKKKKKRISLYCTSLKSPLMTTGIKDKNEFNWQMSNKRLRIKRKKLTSELSWKLWTDLTRICLFFFHFFFFYSGLLAGTCHPRSKLVWVDTMRIQDATILEAFLFFIYLFLFAIQGVKGGLLFETPRSPHMV